MTIDGTTSTDAPPAAFDAATVRAWMGHAVEKFGSARDEIDRLNVFPVPDGDTGTNLYLTIESAAEAVVALPESADASTACEALARGALLGLGELWRDHQPDPAGLRRRGGRLRGWLRRRGDCPGPGTRRRVRLSGCRGAQGGTILSVVRGAAEGAAGAAGTAANSLADVACAALAAAQEALARTPDQLPVLREAGVVDAGGRGLVVLLEALNLAITGVEVPRHAGGGGGGAAASRRWLMRRWWATTTRYEVMYLLDTEQDEAVAGLRSQLNEFGDSVVVVGGRGLWNIHVHTDDIGAAIERAVEIGRPHRIKVTRLLEAESLRSQGRGAPSTRAVVVVAHGPDMADYLPGRPGSPWFARRPADAPRPANCWRGSAPPMRRKSCCCLAIATPSRWRRRPRPQAANTGSAPPSSPPARSCRASPPWPCTRRRPASTMT